MEEEFPDFDFDQAVKDQAGLWARELNMIRVEGSEEDKAIFYTALTKCFVNPRNLSENGRYFSPFDFQVHEGGRCTPTYLYGIPSVLYIRYGLSLSRRKPLM